jgi:hypothetical protein
MNIKKLNNLIDGKKTTKASIIKKTGISRPALDSILEGNDFKVSNLEKIASALCVSVGYFFDEETEVRQAGRDYVEKGKIEHNGTEYNGPVSVADSDLAAENAELKRELIEAQRKIIKLMEERK